jgi:uncharacterized phage protein gp47/JayE
MALFAESEDNIFGEILFNIANETNIRRSSPGSKTRAIAEALSSKLGQMYQVFDTNIALAFIDGATGQYLDFLGNILGLTRLGETAANSLSTEQNVRFYTQLGTFGSINSGQAINIPAGTIVSTGPNGTGIQYQVPYPVILPANLSVYYVGVQALGTGSTNNVGAGQLIYNNINTYTQSVQKTLLVTNDGEITSGQDAETDVNFRYRIANQVVSAESANLTSIRLAVLIVPGVADTVLIPFNKGIGTIDILLKATTPSVPAGLIGAVQDQISNVVAAGIVANVKGPYETGFSLVGTLTTTTVLSPSDQSNLITTVTNNVINYVNNLDIAQPLILEQLEQVVLSSSSQIKNVGTFNQPFDQLYIYQQTKLQDNKIRSTLLKDYTPAADEKVLVELVNAGSTPILFTIA